MALIPTNKISDPIYNCSLLLTTVENDLNYVESNIEYHALQRRQDALLSLINSGIEYTTLAKLNIIARTDT